MHLNTWGDVMRRRIQHDGGNGIQTGTGGIRNYPLMAEPARDAGYVFDRRNPTALADFIELHRSCEIRNLGQPVTDGYHGLGGKNVGLLLLQKAIIDGAFGRYDNVSLAIPDTYMLGSAFFFTFLEHNPHLKQVLIGKYDKKGYSTEDYEDIKRAFLSADMPSIIKNELIVILEKSFYDFYILRSSASCEDGCLPSAGLFESLPFYNDQRRPLEERLENMETVLKEVWASLFGPKAIDMMKRADLNPLAESMQITLQAVVGDWYGNCFCPFMSGVVKSTNNWPWDQKISRQDPVGRIGLGLGTLMVGESGSFKNGGPRIFSFDADGGFTQFLGAYIDPEAEFGGGGHPIMANRIRDDGQTKIDVLQVENGKAVVRTRPLTYNTGKPNNTDGIAHHIPYGLRAVMATERSGTNYATQNRYDFEVYDAVQMAMTIRQGGFFEIGKLIRTGMDQLGEITGEEVSVEFAVKPVRIPGTDRWSFKFYFLQVRPQTSTLGDQEITMTDLTSDTFAVLARSEARAFGHVQTALDRTVVVTPHVIASLGSGRVKGILQQIDRQHRGKYLLVGPDAEAFISGTGVFESIYGGLSPGAVIALKNAAGIVSLAGDSGSHTADNIERAPVIILDERTMEPELRALLDATDKRVKPQPADAPVDAEVLVHEILVNVELDGNSGRGQIFYKK